MMNSLIQQRSKELADLCRRFRVRRLALFGSSLTPQFNAERSDLDFLVEFESLSAGEYARTYFGLLEALESLFERRVDLVEAGAVRNPYVRQEIEANQETLYAT
jgi:uncharacterized protein